MVTVASPSEPEHVLHHFGGALENLDAGLDAHINVAGNDYPVKPQFIEDVRSYHMNDLLSSYDKRLLAIRAGQDALVDARDADEILAYSRAETALVDLPTADHLFSRRQDTDALIEAIADWIV